MGLGSGPVQLAYCVSDVRSAALWWVDRFGAGPFFVRDHIEVADVFVHGEPGGFDHSSAYGQWGPLMVELVTIHDPPSLRSIGLHHAAFFVDSFDRATSGLAAAGWPPALVAAAGETRFAFHDARAELGHLIEIYEGSAPLRRFYTMVADAAVGWDGTDPIRPLV